MDNRLIRIKRMEIATGKCLSIKDSFVTQSQLDAMNKAASDDKTGYQYMAVCYAVGNKGKKSRINK